MQAVLDGSLHVLLPVGERERDAVPSGDDGNHLPIGTLSHKRIQRNHLERREPTDFRRAEAGASALGGARVSHLVEILLGDAAVFNVKDAFERLHVEEVHLLQVLQLQGDAAQLFPHQRSQVEVQGLLGAHGHAHQDAQELELEQVLVQAGRRVQEEPESISRSGRESLRPSAARVSSPVSVVAHLCGGVGGGDEQVDHARLQLLQRQTHVLQSPAASWAQGFGSGIPT